MLPNELEKLESIAVWTKYLTWGFGVVAIILAIIEHFTNQKAPTIRAKIQTEAEMSAKRKVERLANEARNAKYEAKSAKAIINNLKTRRKISPLDESKIIETLNFYKKGKFLIEAVSSKSEPYELAKQLKKILIKGGWTTDLISPEIGIYLIPYEGIKIECQSKGSLRYKALKKAFSKCDISIKWVFSPRMSDDSVYILVGDKPDSI